MVVVPSSTTTTTTALGAQGDGRRRFFSSVKKLFLGASAVTTIVGGRPIPVFAEDAAAGASGGNVIEIQVANLDGQADNTGTIKIQLKPDWAPRGVARFEVSVCGWGATTEGQKHSVKYCTSLMVHSQTVSCHDPFLGVVHC
jgi:hypothetical protein